MRVRCKKSLAKLKNNNSKTTTTNNKPNTKNNITNNNTNQKLHHTWKATQWIHSVVMVAVTVLKGETSNCNNADVLFTAQHPQDHDTRGVMCSFKHRFFSATSIMGNGATQCHTQGDVIQHSGESWAEAKVRWGLTVDCTSISFSRNRYSFDRQGEHLKQTKKNDVR